MADLNACNRTAVITGLMLIGGFILVMCALGTPMWSLSNDGNHHFGLFMSCGWRPVLCDFYTWDKIDTSLLLSVQAMMSLAVLCFIIPCFFAPFYFCAVYQENFPLDERRMTFYSIISMFCAGFFFLLAVCLYIGAVDFEKRNLGISYVLGWLSCFWSVGVGVLYLRIYRSNISITDWLKD